MIIYSFIHFQICVSFGLMKIQEHDFVESSLKNLPNILKHAS